MSKNFVLYNQYINELYENSKFILSFSTPSPTRTETQLRMAPKATDYTNSSNGVSQFFDFLFHHVKDLNQL